MKKILFLLSFAFLFTNVNAKKVKFSVNMTGQTISVYGVHVSGDFQTLAGFAGGDWASNTTLMTQETTDTNIYSIIVDIPAFKKYEYKFLNGDQWYEVEFVPVESRVGYNFNDSRWIFIDSLVNDTTNIGAIMFSGNAPNGYTLLRFVVDMQSQTSINTNGIHVAGNFQGWNPILTRLCNLDTTSKYYEVISYVHTGNYEYKFYNGNTITNVETVPSTCSINGNRMVNVAIDTVIDVVCFASCSACSTVGIHNNNLTKEIKIYPNPTTDYSTLELIDINAKYSIKIINQAGVTVREYQDVNGGTIKIKKESLIKGLYTIIITQKNTSNISFAKLVIM